MEAGRELRSHLVVLFDARERGSYLGVAAPVIGVTHDGNHLEFLQRSDESGQRDPCVLLRQDGRSNLRSA